MMRMLPNTLSSSAGIFHSDALAKVEEAADQIRYCVYVKSQIIAALQRWARAEI